MTNEKYENSKVKQYVKRDDWAPEVKDAINSFIAEYGKDSVNYDETSYVVFDFDNTSIIFDVEEQLAIHQLLKMAFTIEPDNIKNVLSSGLGDLDKDLTHLGYGNGSYNDWIDDINKAYGYLYDCYGPFNAKGLDADKLEAIHEDPMWKEFSTKMRAMYDLVYDNESSKVAYPWILYWFTGMTEKEVYELALESNLYYKDVETYQVLWQSPENIESKVGKVSYKWTAGLQVTENTKELMHQLSENGIKVWVCSASLTEAIKAAIDVWGLHNSIVGMFGMTNCLDKDGKYLPEYDYETGFGFYTNSDGTWTRGTIPQKSQTVGDGKVTVLENTLCKKYGHGPLAGFMDSTGDFNFCTEFKTLKLVICFNRANRKVTDGGALIAELALYQRDYLKYDLIKANNAGDTLYVLQGRDENGKRTFRSSNKTLRYGIKEEITFRSHESEIQLQYMIDNKMSTEEILNTFSITTSENGNNIFDFKYGFLDEYPGYHSHN